MSKPIQLNSCAKGVNVASARASSHARRFCCVFWSAAEFINVLWVGTPPLLQRCLCSQIIAHRFRCCCIQFDTWTLLGTHQVIQVAQLYFASTLAKLQHLSSCAVHLAVTTPPKVRVHFERTLCLMTRSTTRFSFPTTTVRSLRSASQPSLHESQKCLVKGLA